MSFYLSSNDESTDDAAIYDSIISLHEDDEQCEKNVYSDLGCNIDYEQNNILEKYIVELLIGNEMDFNSTVMNHINQLLRKIKEL